MTRAEELERLLQQRPEGMTADQLATRLGLKRNTLVSLITSVNKTGWIVRSEDKYRLSGKPREADMSKELIALLRLYPAGAATNELAAEMDASVGAVSSVLNRLRKDGTLLSEQFRPKRGAVQTRWRLA